MIFGHNCVSAAQLSSAAGCSDVPLLVYCMEPEEIMNMSDPQRNKKKVALLQFHIR